MRKEEYRMALRILLLHVLLGVSFGNAMSQHVPAFSFSFNQPFGKYAVGFKAVQQYDRSRSFSMDSPSQAGPSAPGRPLQTLIWYPAIPSKTPPMTLGNFEDLVAHETSFDNPALHGPPQDFVHSFMQGTENGQTISIENATPEHHRFPVVVYAPSINAPNIENIEICEYLASYGFVVIASPSMGAASRHMAVETSDANAQAEDILFLIKFSKTLKDVSAKDVAVIGYSWGGTGALLAATDDPKIRALVSFDGSFRYGPMQSINSAKFTIPLLFFSRGETPLANPTLSDPTQKANARILNEWTHGDLFQIRMLAISHIQFSSLYQRSERFKREGAHFVPAGYSLRDGDESYGWIARYTMEFLKAYLKHDQNAHTYLMRSPSENDVPARLMMTSFRPAVRE
jgi:dienelactone hydrolase